MPFPTTNSFNHPKNKGYEVSLFFKEPTFPIHLWRSNMRRFQFTEGANPLKYKQDFLVRAEWHINWSEETIIIRLINRRTETHLAPEGSYWEAVIYSSSRLAYNLWVVFAIPYHTLRLYKNVIFYDRANDTYIDNTSDYLRFANKTLPTLTRMRDLRNLDLVNEKGWISFYT